MQFNESKILALMQNAKAKGIFNKAVAGFILPDASHKIVAFETPENSVFDIASLTKVCPTSTLALSYILEGKINLDDCVAKYIPELKTNYREDIRIFHLLTHSLDYRIPMKTLRTLPPEKILHALFAYQFEKAPGADFNYGNPASVLLGIILQRIIGKDLQQQGKETFFEPLGMSRSGFEPLTRNWNKIQKNEIIATEICNFRNREIQGETHDESAWVLQKLYPVGSAGMFSCVPDLLKFVQMILNDGAIFENGEKKQIAPKGILELVSKNAFSIPEFDSYIHSMNSTIKNNACTALGWELNAKKFMGTHTSPRTFGKTGFTGASIVADAEAGAAVILLSNFTYPHREQNANRINAFRSMLADTFFS